MDEFTGGEKAMHKVGEIIYITGKQWRIIKVMDTCLTVEQINTEGKNELRLCYLFILYASIIVLIPLMIFLFTPKAKADCDEIYIKVGTGYKVIETERFVDEENDIVAHINSDPYSARIETGVECGNLTYGISHHSQWRTGFPFNDQNELQKTEIFIDYKFSWGI